MNAVDLLALILAVAALILGLRSGAIPQLFGLGGAVLGVVFAIELIVVFRSAIGSVHPPQRAILSLVIVFVAMAIGETIGSTLGGILRQKFGRGLLEMVDRLAGGVLGIGQALLMIWLLGGLLATSSLPSLNIVAAESVTLRTLAGVLPPPAAISADLHQLLDASGIPDLFVGLEPPPAPGVPPPGQAEANAIARDARPSTVEVETEACGYTLTGTGFSIAPSYVVTNAHVVAGEHAAIIRTETTSYEATLVFFDPELDIAVLHAPGYRSPALQFAKSSPNRGTLSAALGHPGGGPLVVVPAGVTGSYAAEGRDLYGNTFVTREIVELSANIERGDSGGPLVLPDGTVGGVVFAASRVSNDVGYALAPGPVASEVMPAVGRTRAVGAGPCTQ